ncbi:c-type cytochrome [Alsobacter sp. SYSU M60028]|uniref:C-type cytochrome n=1 Tax=Alsobacter ponti TaxID=2962936 RepID=A0ABT1L7F6_9HYPH|nr:c-type cytochrome [Alsobacter ponti]MCP8936928.1 c-type cytochrome [Alsobacter ponti]
MRARTGCAAIAIAAAVMATGAARAEPEAGDPVAGKDVFEQCVKCHAVGPDAATSNAGPRLNGVVGRRSAGDKEYNYSPQFRSARLTWDVATLSRFLKAPKSTVPGTRMLFNGLASPAEIANVIAYLAQFDEAGAVKK